MHLGLADWSVIAAYLLLLLVVGVLFARRAGRSTEEYFLGGRKLPWWILGISMVATTFAADTPLAVTEFVRTDGIWGNWFWWTWAVAHVLAIFLFSRLWRRAGVVTDAELMELRYSGRWAASLRAFKALLMAVLFNVIVLGWVTKAMITVIRFTMPISEYTALFLCVGLAVVYSVTSGFWGVVVTDLFQFFIAMAGSIVFAVFAVREAGGMELMLSNAEAARPQILRMMPPVFGDDPASFKLFVFITVAWWATHNADAGGYMMQRMSAARNEQHAVGAALLFTVTHYALRVWPWVLVALASVTMLPVETFTDHKAAYPAMMTLVLPAGLKGLLVASILSAFMSTVDTHLNWGSSYIVCDLYKRFVRKKAPDRHYVLVGRLSSVVLAAAAVLVALRFSSIKAAWSLLYSLGAGMGPFLILRWFWWRVSAKTELFAAASSIAAGVAVNLLDLSYPLKLCMVAGASLVVSLVATFIFPPEPMEKLVEFYRRVRPGGFWGPVREKTGDIEPSLLRCSLLWDLGLGLILVYGATLGLGQLLFGRFLYAGLLLIPAAAALSVILIRQRRFVKEAGTTKAGIDAESGGIHES